MVKLEKIVANDTTAPTPPMIYFIGNFELIFILNKNQFINLFYMLMHLTMSLGCHLLNSLEAGSRCLRLS